MNKEKNIALVLMAAGQSSRMKGIKQLLPWNGTTLLLHALSTMLDVQKDKVFMVLGANDDRIRTESKLEHYPVSIIKNEHWKDGLGSSIACGIRFVLDQEPEVDGVLIGLADQPLLTSDYYKELIKTFNNNRSPIIATKYPNKSGVPAIFKTDIAKELIHLKEDYGARFMMSKYKEELITLDAGVGIKDIDTPETYAWLYNQYNLPQE